jgi:hypothetical protein
MEQTLVSPIYKKQLMDLGFRHSEAKCLLECMKRHFKEYLDTCIDELTIFYMHDAIYAIRFNIIRPKNYRYKFDYLPLFRMVSHKTKKILRTWLNKYHPNNICKCNLCLMFNNLKKLSEFEIHYYRERIIRLPDSYISLIMYHYFRLANGIYSQMNHEYIFFSILFNMKLFQSDYTNFFSYEHKNVFFSNIKQYLNNKKKLDLFHSLAVDNYYLPPELLNKIHNLVLAKVN